MKKLWSPVDILTIEEEESTDYQLHMREDEEWHILEGTGSYVLGDEEAQFMEGDIFFIPSGTPYRFHADRETVILKVMNGWFNDLEEEEIVKLKDEYGRI